MSMRCCICGQDFSGYGNNPYPLCHKDDYESRCCNDCDMIVINARRLQMSAINEDWSTLSPDMLKEKLNHKTIVIFYSKDSNQPIDTYMNFGKFLAGNISNEEDSIKNKKIKGTWGNFQLDIEEDSYCVLDD